MLNMMKRLATVLGVVMLLMAFAPAASFGAGEVRVAGEFVQEKFYFLAEGCTRDGFDTWLTVLNRNDGTVSWGYTQPANPYWKLEVVYITNDGVVATKTYDLPKESRTTINVNAEIGAGYDVAFKLTTITNCPGNYSWEKPGGIFIERPMYFSYVGTGGHAPWQGGHVNAASTGVYDGKLVTTQYFAEGTTRRDSERQFDEWICVLNPSDQPATLTFNYMIEGEGLVVRKDVVPAKHRSTWYVPDHVGLNKDVSLELISDVGGVLAERSMYFSYRSVNPQRPGRNWYGGHVITGVPAKESTWFRRTFAFAPVSYVPGMGWADTWVCLQNPNETDVPVKITFSTLGGLMAFIKWLPAQQRSTFYYPQLLAEFSVASSREPGAFRVESIEGYPGNIQVERPLYMEFARPATTGQTPSGGTVIAGNDRNRATYAEGYTGAGFDTWVARNYFDDSEEMREYWEDSVANQEGNWLQAKCYFPDGAVIDWGAKNQALLASGYRGHWYTYMWHVNDDFPNTAVSIYVNGGDYSERIMVFSYMGKWSGMHSSGIGCVY